LGVTQSEVIWFFFQALVLGIAIVGLDWDARGEGLALKWRLAMIGALIVATVFLGSPGVIGCILAYWVYTRHFR